MVRSPGCTPLIPNGKELVATLMFEIDDRVRRTDFLSSLGGVEETITLSFAGETVLARPEEDVDRTTADGKASAIQFLHFPFNDEQIANFRQAGTKVTLAVGHEKYPESVREALSRDFAQRAQRYAGQPGAKATRRPLRGRRPRTLSV